MDERGSIVETTTITESRVDSLALAPGAALVSVRNAYIALGLEPNYVDPAKGIVGIRQGIVARRLQGVPVTAYVDCGLDMNGVPFAANDRVEVTMLTEVRPSGTGATMITSLAARALRTSSGASVNPQRCASRGSLERKLAGVVKGAP
ncbi:MAG TPA: hypothetical protein VEA99_06565, partial [Gemmatimonadaceae bacterium]|nr:hypothetical protein [Gemmatimonadaceae bacterium]